VCPEEFAEWIIQIICDANSERGVCRRLDGRSGLGAEVKRCSWVVWVVVLRCGVGV